MKRIVVSLLSLVTLLALGGCQSKFDPPTALKESRETLVDFLGLYEGKEQLVKTYDKKSWRDSLLMIIKTISQKISKEMYYQKNWTN